MRDFPQNFVERDSKRGNWTVRRSRAGRVPLLQRVGFPDTLRAPCGECTAPSLMGLQRDQANILMRIPAATAEPMTPATLGPMACMSR